MLLVFPEIAPVPQVHACECSAVFTCLYMYVHNMYLHICVCDMLCGYSTRIRHYVHLRTVCMYVQYYLVGCKESATVQYIELLN